MHDLRYATVDATRRFATHLRCGLRRADLFRWLVVCAAAPIAACQPAGVLDPQGPIASAERLLLINSTAIMLVVVVPVILATLGFAWWYRSSNPRASHAWDQAYEGRIEFVIWSIPALIVILLGGVIWIGSHELDPRAPILADGDPSRSGSRSWRSIGNGCSFTPIRALPRSTNWSCRWGPRSTSA